MDENDDEISIDLSKITKFFKKGKKEVQEEAKELKQEVREDIKKEEEKIDDIKQEMKEQPDEIQELKEEIKEEKEKIEELKKDEHIIEKAEKEASAGKIEAAEEDLEKVKESVEESEDDISIDLGKLKRKFTGMFKKSKEEVKEDDEISFNPKDIGRFVSKHKVALLILIPFLLAFVLRMYPAYLPITDDWATDSVQNSIRSQIRGSVSAQYPNLPNQNRDALVEREYNKVWRESKDQIEGQIRDTSEYFKSRMKDDNGNTYLLAIDPYFWTLHARNIVENGHPGDSIKDGRPYDDHMIAPLGRPVPADMGHAYLEAIVYKFVRFFNRDAELMGVAFYFPVILASLAVIPAYLLARKIAGDFAGFIAGLIVAVHPAFLGRTAGGFADTDAYNVLLPLCMILFLFIAIEATSAKKRYGFAGLAGLLVGLYAWTWGGWWFILDFALVTLGAYLLYLLVVNWKRGNLLKNAAIKNLVFVIIVLIASSGIFVSLFVSPSVFPTFVTAPVVFTTIKDVATTTVWPNVFTTVAEQNEIPLRGIINNIGGNLMFTLALIGIVLTFWKKDDKGKADPKYAVLMVIWFIGTVYASTKGVRWILLLVPAYGIALGSFFGILKNKTSTWLSKGINVQQWMSSAVIIIIVAILLMNPIKAGFTIAKREVPSMNDGWHQALTEIKLNSSEDAIITSWWDFGHWFKNIADRPVTFDGTSQGTPMAHWVGKSLLTGDEDVSIGILRMLDCGSNNAFEELDKVIQKPYKSVEILNEVIVQDKRGALATLNGYGLDNNQAAKVLVNTHCDPPEAFYIASDDMIGKSGVWSHFGIWDFRRSTIFNQVRSMGLDEGIGYLVDEFNYTESDAESLYYEVTSLGVGRDANDWIAPWPSYASGVTDCSGEGDLLKCGNGLEVDINTYAAYVSGNGGRAKITSLGVLKDDKINKVEYEDSQIGVSGLLIPKTDGFRSMLMSPQLVDSIFTRLFFLEGHGLRHFKPFTFQQSFTGGRIFVYKIDWAGSEPNIMSALTQQEQAQQEVKARHILVNTSEEAEEILELLENGSDFEQLAQERSIGPSAERGGDLGWFGRAAMVQEFSDAAFALQPGEISDVVQTQFGYHVIKVEDRRDGREPAVPEAQENDSSGIDINIT